MAKLFCHLLMKVNHVIIAKFYVANMYLLLLSKNKILAKILEFTVTLCSFAVTERMAEVQYRDPLKYAVKKDVLN